MAQMYTGLLGWYEICKLLLYVGRFEIHFSLHLESTLFWQIKTGDRLHEKLNDGGSGEIKAQCLY